MLLNPLHKLLKLPTQCHCRCPENQLVQVLSVVWLHRQTGVHVLVNEHIIEHDNICQRAIPGIVLEDRRWRAAAAFENRMRRMLSGEASTLSDGQGIARR
jgi:hypothetical protein